MYRTLLFSILPLLAWADRYTLILDDAPAATPAGRHEQIAQRQRTVRQQVESRGLRVTGAVDTVLNALFVEAPPARVEELSGLAGVKGVVAARRVRPALNKASVLVNAPAAWARLGGQAEAGKGVKIGIVDSGIDQNHPAFRNSRLPIPPGFPKCATQADCQAFTNNKVIVARSFIDKSRPDDYSPRDHLGHGTAVASCVAGETVTGLVTFSGLAPGAQLGSYKVFGSPGANDDASDQVVMAALEQAVKDGMDIINMSLGDRAMAGPLDTGAACGNAAGVPCDPLAQAVENAIVQKGVVVVISAGNDGADGKNYPTFNSIGSPGTTPSAITVGATSDSHAMLATVSLAGPGAPQNLRAVPGTSGLPLKGFTGPLVDVGKISEKGDACADLPPGSLYGAVALVKSDGCRYVVAARNTLNAGAVGMVLYRPDARTLVSGTAAFLPFVMVTNVDGVALKNHLGSNPGAVVTVLGSEQDNVPDRVLRFSSTGPATGDLALKPDLVAPGGSDYGTAGHLPGIYMAAQTYDVQGNEYNVDGFTAAQGTSFAAPIAAGVAALVKQAHPNFTPAQVKSALVNTAATTVQTDDSSNKADTQWFGAGRLDASAAISTFVTVSVTDNATDTRLVSSVSFGALTSRTLPLVRTLTIYNTGDASITVTPSVAPGSQGGLVPAISPAPIIIAAGRASSVNLSLSGALPAPGAYSGVINIQGGNVPLRVPYLYFVSDGKPANVLQNDTDPSLAGAPLTLWVKLLDRFGVPLTDTPVHWITDSAKSSLSTDYSNTNRYGIATMKATLGTQSDDHPFWAQAGDLTAYWSYTTQPKPVVQAANALLNAASFDTSQPVGPGSYATVFGTNMSTATAVATTARLPVALEGSSVSFEVAAAGISAPGHVSYVSPGQINVQVPWELAGQSTAQMRVRSGDFFSDPVRVNLADFSPSLFEIGNSVPAALDLGYQLITTNHPAERGKTVMLFANGLGPVSSTPASGDIAVVTPLSEVLPSSVLAVTIGGRPAQVQFAGLAPGFPGLYQLNVVVPADIAAGSQPITVTVGGRTSKASLLPVR